MPETAPAVLLAAFDEAKHPRVPGGHGGGEFTRAAGASRALAAHLRGKRHADTTLPGSGASDPVRTKTNAHLTAAADHLDRAAGHLDAGRGEEGRKAISQARRSLFQYHALRGETRLSQLGLAGEADKIHAHVLRQVVSQRQGGAGEGGLTSIGDIKPGQHVEVGGKRWRVTDTRPQPGSSNMRQLTLQDPERPTSHLYPTGDADKEKLKVLPGGGPAGGPVNVDRELPAILHTVTSQFTDPKDTFLNRATVRDAVTWWRDHYAGSDKHTAAQVLAYLDAHPEAGGKKARDAGPGSKPAAGDYVEHPFGRGRRSTSRVRRVEGDNVVVTRRGKNYTYPLSQIRRAAAFDPAGRVRENHPDCPADKPFGVTGPDGTLHCHATRQEAQDLALTLNYPDADQSAAPGGVQVGAAAALLTRGLDVALDALAAAGGGADKNRGNAETLRRYWSTGGEGGAKIRWGEGGDHMRCVAQLMEHGHFSEDQAHGYCNLLEKRNTGESPAQHAHRDQAASGEVIACSAHELRDRFGKWMLGGGGGTSRTSLFSDARGGMAGRGGLGVHAENLVRRLEGAGAGDQVVTMSAGERRAARLVLHGSGDRDAKALAARIGSGQGEVPLSAWERGLLHDALTMALTGHGKIRRQKQNRGVTRLSPAYAAVLARGPGGWSHGWKRDDGPPRLRETGTPYDPARTIREMQPGDRVVLNGVPVERQAGGSNYYVTTGGETRAYTLAAEVHRAVFKRQHDPRISRPLGAAEKQALGLAHVARSVQALRRTRQARAAGRVAAAQQRVPKGGPGGGQFGSGSGGATPTNAAPVQQGQDGQTVKFLQERLNALGAKPKLAVDGKFGPQTLAAVKAYQASQGLKVDGLVGPLTTGALRAKIQKKAPAVTKGHTTKTTSHTTSKPSGGGGAGGAASKPATSKTSGGKATSTRTAAPATTRKAPATARTAKAPAAKPLSTKPGSISPAQQRQIRTAVTGREVPAPLAKGVMDPAAQKAMTEAEAHALVTFLNTYPQRTGRSGKAAPVTRAAAEVAAKKKGGGGFDESKHPRIPGGKGGGEFAPAGEPGAKFAHLAPAIAALAKKAPSPRAAEHYGHATEALREGLAHKAKYHLLVARDLHPADARPKGPTRDLLIKIDAAKEAHPFEHAGAIAALFSGVKKGKKKGKAPRPRPEGISPFGNRKPSKADALAFAQLFGASVAAAAGEAGPVAVPSLVTLPGVDILAAGTWQLSTGRQTFTREDLAQAVDAAQCPAIGRPIIKIGHLDQRFAPGPGDDGEPGIGRVTNLRLNESGTKVVGDLAGMPGWLGAIGASAFPRRSVEGKYGFTCQIGHKHPFVLTALALLGVTPPGVGVLGGLDDIAALYGVTAAAAPGWQAEQSQEGHVMPVTEEDVRRAWYASAGAPQSWWITELQMSPAQLIVADEASGAIYRVPFDIEGSAVTFGDPGEIVSHAELAASRGTGPAVVYASAADSRAGVVMAAWDGAAAVRNLGDNPTAAQLKALFALPGATKSDSSLPHHDVGPDGKVGAANPDGCSAAIAAINGARGGLVGASADAKKTAHGHLSAHLRSAGKEPPEFKADAGDQGEGDAGDEGAAIDAIAGRIDRLDRIGAAAAAQTNAPEDIGQLIADLDATLDRALAALDEGGADHPDAASHIEAAEGIADQLLGKLGIPDPDDAGETETAASADDDAEGEVGAASGDAGPSGKPGDFTGKHSHAHPTTGDQGSDETHEHMHGHNGDALHDHAHETQAAAAAAATPEGGDSSMGYEFTDQQMAAIRSRLGKKEGEAVTTDDIAAAMAIPRAPVVAATAGGSDTADVQVPQISDGTYLVDGEILRNYQERAVAGDQALHRLHLNERDGILASAVTDGTFSLARKPHFEALWAKDPEGTRKLVASLAPGLVPMGPPRGFAGEFGGDPDMPGDFEGQQAYRDLYPDDYARERQQRRDRAGA